MNLEGTLSDNSFENSLKCDFPARESFRESLLEDLLAMNETEQRTSLDERTEKTKDTGRAILLDDAELEMLAAAEGEQRVYRNPLEEGPL